MRRALRRHHLDRMKKKRLRQIRIHTFPKDFEVEKFAKLVGLRVRSASNCSCQMCGNPRKYWKEKTWQERKSEQKFEREIYLINNKLW